MPSRLVIIDGHNLLFKAFSGIPVWFGRNGTPLNATVGFIGMLRKIILQLQPTHLAVIFDSVGSCQERKTLYPDYKATRPIFSPTDAQQNPFIQLPDIQKALTALKIFWKEALNAEADDVIATLALGARMPAVIVSADSDFFQLVSKRIQVHRYRGKKSLTIDEVWLQQRFGLSPRQLIRYKAITGDKADNIAGLKGFGEKRALRVIDGSLLLSTEQKALVRQNEALITLKRRASLHTPTRQMTFRTEFKGFKTMTFLRELEIF